MRIATLVPWYGKMLAKLILARIPVSYAAWRRLGLFVHGDMTSPDYAFRVFSEHFAEFQRLAAVPQFVCLELGPGDSLMSAVCAAAYGASRSLLVDNGDYAARDMLPYTALARTLVERGLPAPDLSAVSDLSEVLSRCDATYLCNGVHSLMNVETNSVNFLFSHAVLEHVRYHEFRETIRQTRRVVVPGGVCSHRVDLQDHLGGGLNNLRFGRSLWESEVMSSSAFYTNRIRCAEMLRIFADEGFEVESISLDRFPQLPLARRHLAREFERLEDDDLLVKGFSVVLR
jgi:hypothetical protein